MRHEDRLTHEQLVARGRVLCSATRNVQVLCMNGSHYVKLAPVSDECVGGPTGHGASGVPHLDWYLVISDAWSRQF